MSIIFCGYVLLIVTIKISNKFLKNFGEVQAQRLGEKLRQRAFRHLEDTTGAPPSPFPHLLTFPEGREGKGDG